MTESFYQDSLDVLSPLRYHLHELVLEMESYNRFAQRMNYPKLSEKKIDEAKKFLDVAELFFCTRKH